VSRTVESFGGDGAHEVRIQTEQGEQTVLVKRDLWFDRDDDRSWVVWAQDRPWDDHLPAEGEVALGSIVVTNPAVMAFIDQLGELLADPARFRHEPAVDGGAELPKGHVSGDGASTVP
jgi:hypothetical protein